MPFAEATNATLEYSISGAGTETLVLVCGLGAHASEWAGPFRDRLNERMRVVSLDNRAIGNSRSAVSSWTMQDMAHDVLAVMDAAGVPQAHVLGTSMGGMIAQCLAVAHPERLKRLILMATGSGGRDHVHAEPRAAATFKPTPELSVGEVRRLSLTGVTAEGFPAEHPEVIEALIELRVETPTPIDTWTTQYAAILASDRSQLVTQIHVPTLVVHGDVDPLIPLENGRRLAERIPGAKLVVLPNCGHIPYIEMPERAAQTVIDFVFG